MRKLFILGLIITFFGFVQKAEAQAQVALGIKAGLNFAKLDIENFSTDSRTGFHGGAFALFKLTKIGIQPELLYSSQGTDFPNGKSDLTYLNIPVLLKFYLVGGFNIYAGPQFGFLTGAETTVSGTTTDIKDQLKGSDISAALGAGIDLPFGLTLDARYNLGLSEVNDTSGSSEAKNQVFQISAGMKLFKFGK